MCSSFLGGGGGRVYGEVDVISNGVNMNACSNLAKCVKKQTGGAGDGCFQRFFLIPALGRGERGGVEYSTKTRPRTRVCLIFLYVLYAFCVFRLNGACCCCA